MILKSLLLLAVLAGTWNIKWFPSGRAEHRAKPAVEAERISAAAAALREALPGSGRIVFLQEMRSAQICTNLVAATGDANLHVAAATAFRDFRDNRLQWQQLAIVTDLPVLESRWKYAKRPGKLFVPRGYAYALLDAGEEGKIACFCIHLKSNYGAKGDDAKKTNMEKRAAIVGQVLAAAAECGADKIIIAGDFNSDRFQKEFEGERVFSMLKEAGFEDAWRDVPPDSRGTHPGRGRYPDSTLDYVFHKGFAERQPASLAPAVYISDHRMVVVKLK